MTCLKRAFSRCKPEIMNSDYVEKETMTKRCLKVLYFKVVLLKISA